MMRPIGFERVGHLREHWLQMAAKDQSPSVLMPGLIAVTLHLMIPSPVLLSDMFGSSRELLGSVGHRPDRNPRTTQLT
jgi:hypothetical protein